MIGALSRLAKTVGFIGGFVVNVTLFAATTRILDVSKAGVLGDGVTNNTARIQKLIDDEAATGGATLYFPAGRYLTGSIEIKSNVTLRLDEQATLLGSTNPTDYRNFDPFIDGSGNRLGDALIVAVNADHVGIEGRGTIDGRGPQLKANERPYTMRPFLVRWVKCRNVCVRDVHLRNPGAWTLNFYRTEGALVERVTIRSRGLGMNNNDGINIDASEDIHVRDCDVVSGDDALVIKATSANTPSRNITATGCRLSTGTNAIKLGTESIGRFEHISVSNCHISNARMAGIALYDVDGGELKDVTISDVAMDGVAVPISIRLGARLHAFREREMRRRMPGRLHHVRIENVSARNVGIMGILINGVPGHPVENLTLANVSIEVPGGGTSADAPVQLPENEKAYPEYNMFGTRMPVYGVYARHVRHLTLENVKVVPRISDERPAAAIFDGEDVRGHVISTSR
ncbi:MAG TPA: glycosyl hydrolase family 28 protein [Opitutaceae bacterium]|nr:glycosyl hydrolase family 28 protein [Opitutaceae bacterium]